MQSLTDRASVDAALTDLSLDPDLRTLLAARARQLDDDTEPDIPLHDVAHFHVVGSGDGIDDIERTIGIPIDMAPWEWIDQHDTCFELVFVVSDDGFGHVVFVPDREGIDVDLLTLCRSDPTLA